MTKLQTWWSGTSCTSYKCNGELLPKWKFISKEFGLVISKVVCSGGSDSLSMVIHLKFYYTSWTHNSVVIIINWGALILWIDTGAFFWEGLLYYTLLVLPRQHGFWRSVIYDVIGWLFALPHMRGIVVVVFIDRFIYLHFQTSIAADDRPNVASYVTEITQYNLTFLLISMEFEVRKYNVKWLLTYLRKGLAVHSLIGHAKDAIN